MPERYATDEEIAADFPDDDDDELDDMEGYDEDDDEDEPEDAIPVGVSPDDPYVNRVTNEEPITLEELEAVDDTAEEKFFVKQWSRYVVLKGISMEELKHIRRKANTKAVRMARARRDVMERELLIAGLVQPKVDEVSYIVLQQKSAGAVADIANRILDKSGMGDTSEKARERRFPRG